MVRTGLRSRLKTVEVEVERLTNDVAETRIMAAKNDKDLAPFRQQLRAHIRVLNALRDTQIEHGKTLDKHGKILGRLTATVDQHTAKLDEHTAKLDEHTAKLDEHGVSLKTLVAGQAKIMEHLGITADNGDASRN
jgi:chromosome segregation ATPase